MTPRETPQTPHHHQSERRLTTCPVPTRRLEADHPYPRPRRHQATQGLSCHPVLIQVPAVATLQARFRLLQVQMSRCRYLGRQCRPAVLREGVSRPQERHQRPQPPLMEQVYRLGEPPPQLSVRLPPC